MTGEATITVSPPPFVEERERRAKPWRILTVSSGLFLAATFFLPAGVVCNSPLSPYRGIHNAISERLKSPAYPDLQEIGEWLMILAVLFVAYAFGILMAIGALSRLLKWKRCIKIAAMALVALMVFDCLILLASFTIATASRGGISRFTWDLDTLFVSLAFDVGPFFVLAYLIFARRMFPFAYLGRMFAGSLAAVLWFGWWAIMGTLDKSALYGLYLSLTAAVLLFISSIGEGRTLTGHGWRKTFWHLLTCRLRLPQTGHCPQCEYYLYGLTEPRCPECGRPFSFEELGITPEALGFAATNEPGKPGMPGR